jgi:hypothetical protein
MEAFPSESNEKKSESVQEKIASMADIYGESVQKRIDELAVGFEWMDHELMQIYIACPKDVLGIVATYLAQKSEIHEEDILEIRIASKNDMFDEILSQNPPHDRPFLVIAGGFSEAGVVGHSLNQNTHQRFSESDLLKGIVLIHINPQDTCFSDALRTAKDSQFKASVIEINS